MQAPNTQISTSTRKRVHPEGELIQDLLKDRFGYWTGDIQFLGIDEIRFSSPPPFGGNPRFDYYHSNFTFNENVKFLATKHDPSSNLANMQPDDTGNPGGYSLFCQTVAWYDLAEFVNEQGMLDVDLALLQNQRVRCGRLTAPAKTSSTHDMTQESMGRDDSSQVALACPPSLSLSSAPHPRMPRYAALESEIGDSGHRLPQ